MSLSTELSVSKFLNSYDSNEFVKYSPSTPRKPKKEVLQKASYSGNDITKNIGSCSFLNALPSNSVMLSPLPVRTGTSMFNIYHEKSPSLMSTDSQFVFPNISYRSLEINMNSGKSCLNPDLYKKNLEEESDSSESETDDPEGNNIKLKLYVRYWSDVERLEIVIKEIKNIHPSIRKLGIRLTLLPNLRSIHNLIYYAKEKDTKKNRFKVNEKISIHVSSEELNKHILKFTLTSGNVKDSKEICNNKLGEVTQALCDLNLTTLSNNEFTLSLHTPSKESRIYVSLCFNPSLPRLSVSIFECLGLDFLKRESENFYVKISIQRNIKKFKRSKKTDIVKNQINPNFAESVHFKIKKEELPGMTLKIAVIEQPFLFGKGCVVGQVIIGGSVFCQGSGEKHWNKMLEFQKEHIQMWHVISKVYP